MPVEEPPVPRRKRKWIVLLLIILIGIFLFILFESGGFGRVGSGLKNKFHIGTPVRGESPGTLTGGEAPLLPVPTAATSTPSTTALASAPSGTRVLARRLSPPTPAALVTPSASTPVTEPVVSDPVPPAPPPKELVIQPVTAPIVTIFPPSAFRGTAVASVSDTVAPVVVESTGSAVNERVEQVVVTPTTTTAETSSTIEVVAITTPTSTAISEVASTTEQVVVATTTTATVTTTAVIGDEATTTVASVTTTADTSHVTTATTTIASSTTDVVPLVIEVATTMPSETSATTTTTTTTSETSSASTTPVVVVPEIVVPIVIPTPPPAPDTDPPPIPLLSVTLTGSIATPTLAIAVSGIDALSPTTTYDVSFASVSTTQLSTLVTSTLAFTDLATSTPQTNFVIPVVRGRTYLVRARATDGVGNRSAWSADFVYTVPFTQDVVINEVAWAGTSAQNPTAEWFELYNNTTSTIDLSKWKLLIAGKAIGFDFVTSTKLAPNGYYLFEQNNDNTIPSIKADIIYDSFAGLPDAGAKLQLLNPGGQIIDEVDASAAWFGGDKIKYRSMERLDPLKSGSDSTNWQTNQGQRLLGGSFIYGSPRQSNFGFIALIGRQDDTVRTLTKINNPYILQGYEIPTNYSLVVQPGVVIKSAFPTASFDLTGGQLIVNGTANDRVVFTSGRDQAAVTNDGSLLAIRSNTIVGTAGNGANGTNWATGIPQAKDWQGTRLRPGASATLNGVDYRYAGTDFQPDNLVFTAIVSQAIRAETATLSIANSTFTTDGSIQIFAIKNSTTTISNTSFNGGDRAIDTDTSALSLSDVTASNFTNNTGPFWIKKTQPTLVRLTLTNNGKNLVYLDGVTVKQSATWGKEVPWLVNSLTVAANTTLTIDPGTTIAVTASPAPGSIIINGSLQAMGTALERIVFKSLDPADWWRSIIFNNSTSTIQFADITRGNQTQAQADGVIIGTNSNLTITDSTILDPRAPGNIINVTNSSLTIKNTTLGFTQHQSSGNALGIKASKGSLSLDGVIFKNLDIAMSAVGTPFPVLSVVHMTASSNFPGTTTKISPANWFTFPL